jgi:hypothetical protein
VDPSLRTATRAVILRWNARRGTWSVVEHPASAMAGTVLHDIVALAADDVWAVGAVGAEALFLHWDGTAWTSHAAPGGDVPQSVDGVAGNDVWAASATGNYHWDGTRWTFQQIDVPMGARRAVAVAGPCDAWAITSWSDGSGSAARVERLAAPGPVDAVPEPVPAPPTTPEVPGTPVALVAEPRSLTEIAVSWRPASESTSMAGGTSFVVERCIGEAGACLTPFEAVHKTGLVTSFVDSGLERGTAYAYRVFAVNESGASDPTAPVTARTPVGERTPTVGPRSSTTVPGPRSSIPVPTTVPGPRSSIPAPTTAPGPRTSTTAPAPAPVPLPTTTTDNDVDLRVPPPVEPPATPRGFAVQPTAATQITLSWLPANGASLSGPTIVIERCIGADADCVTFDVISKVGPTVTSYRDGNLRPGTSYTYRIYAASPSGESAPTVPLTARTPSAPGPNDTHVSADSFDVPRPAPTPRSSVPVTSPNDVVVCAAVTADILIHPDLSAGTSAALLEIVLRDAQGERVEGGCLPVRWTLVVDDPTARLSRDARISVDPSTRFATVLGNAGTYTIRATAGDLVSAAVVTLS